MHSRNAAPGLTYNPEVEQAMRGIDRAVNAKLEAPLAALKDALETHYPVADRAVELATTPGQSPLTIEHLHHHISEEVLRPITKARGYLAGGGRTANIYPPPRRQQLAADGLRAVACEHSGVPAHAVLKPEVADALNAVRDGVRDAISLIRETALPVTKGVPQQG